MLFLRYFPAPAFSLFVNFIAAIAVNAQEIAYGDWHYSGPSTGICEALTESNGAAYTFRYFSETSGDRTLVFITSRKRLFGSTGSSVDASIQFSDGTWNEIGQLEVGDTSEIGQLLVLKDALRIDASKMLDSNYMRLHINRIFVATFSLKGSTKAINAYLECISL